MAHDTQQTNRKKVKEFNGLCSVLNLFYSFQVFSVRKEIAIRTCFSEGEEKGEKQMQTRVHWSFFSEIHFFVGFALFFKPFSSTS